MIDAEQNGWNDLLSAFDFRHLQLSGEIARHWPDGFLAEWVACGLLRELPPASTLACRECPESCYGDVIESGRTLLSCPVCGVYEILPDLARRWQLDRSVLSQLIRQSLDVEGRIFQPVPDILVRLGRIQVPVWLMFQSWRREYREALDSLTGLGLLLVPQRRPVNALPDTIIVGTLAELTQWRDGQLQWDRHQLDQWQCSLQASSPGHRQSDKRRRRSRVMDIEALTGELCQHLQVARDHAFHTLDTTGIPELLPRPTQKELAHRLNLTESRVSRSLKDPGARELKLLWDLADNLEGILQFGRENCSLMD